MGEGWGAKPHFASPWNDIAYPHEVRLNPLICSIFYRPPCKILTPSEKLPVFLVIQKAYSFRHFSKKNIFFNNLRKHPKNRISLHFGPLFLDIVSISLERRLWRRFGRFRARDPQGGRGHPPGGHKPAEWRRFRNFLRFSEKKWPKYAIKRPNLRV